MSSSLAGAEYVCIALDVWTSRSTQGFVAVEATFVDSAFAAHTYLISFTRLTRGAKQVLRVVTDNASSIIKAFAFTGWENEEDNDDGNFDDFPERFTNGAFKQIPSVRAISISLHSLQLAVKDFSWQRGVMAVGCPDSVSRYCDAVLVPKDAARTDFS
ncbi:hypothetical protein MTO96_035600 [Rhipicephalus appendiculatus]